MFLLLTFIIQVCILGVLGSVIQNNEEINSDVNHRLSWLTEMKERNGSYNIPLRMEE